MAAVTFVFCEGIVTTERAIPSEHGSSRSVFSGHTVTTFGH